MSGREMELLGALGEAEDAIRRLLIYVELHYQMRPGWNGNRFDDDRFAREALEQIRAAREGR